MSDVAFTPCLHTPQSLAEGFRAWAPVADEIAQPPLSEQDAFADGFEQGQQLAHAAFAQERARLLALVASAAQLQPVDWDGIGQLVVSTVERLVHEMTGTIPVDRTMLVSQIDELLVAAEGVADTKILHLHPDDVALLADAPIAVAICADATIQPGSMRLHLDEGVIEHGRGAMGDALVAALAGGGVLS